MMFALTVLITMVDIVGAYVITENSAKHRRAFQSSEYEVSPGPGIRAVDGNKASNYNSDKSCSHTDHSVNPWWAVELDEPLNIVCVDIINRGDCCQSRLHDFNVGISDVSPLVRPPIPGNYSLCNHVPGTVGVQVNVTCENDSKGRNLGRYVIIQIVSLETVTDDALSLCEVSVYTEPVSLPVVNNPIKAQIDRKMAAMFNMDGAFFTSKIICIALCRNVDECGSINFRRIKGRINGDCELNRIKYHVLVDDGDDGSIAAENWHWYKLI